MVEATEGVARGGAEMGAETTVAEAMAAEADPSALPCNVIEADPALGGLAQVVDDVVLVDRAYGGKVATGDLAGAAQLSILPTQRLREESEWSERHDGHTEGTESHKLTATSATRVIVCGANGTDG